jgi:O-6-methylguanine DNA methyltransferase
VKELVADTIATPLGPLRLVADAGTLVFVDFAENEGRREQLLGRRYGAFQLIEQRNPHGFAAALERYFAGAIDVLDTLPVDPGGTDFQRRAWMALREIPAGQTLSYGELAARLGAPGAARAVGITNGRNPLSIVLPCHRVIGANRTLTGYAGGLERKRWLLRHEGALAEQARLL